MANLRTGHYGTAKANAAAGVVTWGVGEIPGDGVVAYYVQMIGGGIVGDITRIRILAGGQTIYDIQSGADSAFSCIMQRLSMGNYAPSWAADTWLEIPLYFMDVDENDDRRYLSQFPPGQSPTLELTTGAGGSAETIKVGWRRCLDIKPQFYPLMLGSAMNIAASQNNAVYRITTPGLVRAYCLEVDGLDRIKVTMANEEVDHLRGGMLRAVEACDDCPTGGATGLTAEKKCVELNPPRPAVVPGTISCIEVDTAAGWDGVANELSLYSMVPIV